MFDHILRNSFAWISAPLCTAFVAFYDALLWRPLEVWSFVATDWEKSATSAHIASEHSLTLLPTTPWPEFIFLFSHFDHITTQFYAEIVSLKKLVSGWTIKWTQQNYHLNLVTYLSYFGHVVVLGRAQCPHPASVITQTKPCICI